MSTKTEFPVLAELDPDQEYVEVRFAYNPEFVKAIRRVPSARFRGKDKPRGPYWRIDCDLADLRKLREVFGSDLGLGDKLKAWGLKAVKKEQGLTNLSQAEDAELSEVLARLVAGVEDEETGDEFALRPYQKADVKFMASTNVINANQPGAGKTVETVCAILEAGLADRPNLVFAPIASLRTIWEYETKRYYRLAGLDEPVILTGDTPAERRNAVEQAKRLADEGEAFFLVLNPAMARLRTAVMLDGEEVTKAEFKKLSPRDKERTTKEEVLSSPLLAEIDWASMTIDEFHLMGLSNPTTLGARGVHQIAETTQPEKRFALSGTPMGGKPIKLWGALRFLDPDRFTSRWNWARHWLVINVQSHPGGEHSSIEGIMPGREVDFYEHLKPYLVRRTKREALPGLPPKQRIDVNCPMTPKQAEQYHHFATEAEWRIDDAEESGRLTATNILAEYTRLKQFAGAFCEVKKTGKENNGIPELEVRATADSGKLEQLLEKLAEENVLAKGEDDDEPRQALVFSQNNSMVAMVAEELESRGVPVGRIDGSVSMKKRTALATAFQKEGTIRVLVMNTKAGGTALNLSKADSVHILDETWVPDDQEQAEDRGHRGDEITMAKDEVRMYYYRTIGSIEEYIKRLVADKQLNNKTILDLRRRMQEQAAKEAS